jgi:hypothetical protein
METSHRAKKLVGLAGAMFPTSLAGPPKLAVTAAALGAYTIGQEHAEVIDAAMATKPAERLDPAVWATVEKQLAEWAHDYRNRARATALDATVAQLCTDDPTGQRLHTAIPWLTAIRRTQGREGGTRTPSHTRFGRF